MTALLCCSVTDCNMLMERYSSAVCAWCLTVRPHDRMHYTCHTTGMSALQPKYHALLKCSACGLALDSAIQNCGWAFCASEIVTPKYKHGYSCLFAEQGGDAIEVPKWC